MDYNRRSAARRSNFARSPGGRAGRRNGNPMSTARQAPQFRIGPSGWSYPDWYGCVYPRRTPSSFRPLRLISELFNTVEVNTTFYAVPEARVTERWPPQVNADFRFAVKLHQSLTHERGDIDAALLRAFDEATRPIRAAGMLGPLLIQFPWSFRFGPPAADYLRRLADALPGYERFIEVRHASWSEPEALEALAAAGGVCNIDQPRLPQNLAPREIVTGGTAYARLHGRNAANWFAEGLPPFERYNYLYGEAELREWAERLSRLATRAQTVYAFANNHYRGQGVANALELRAMLEGGRVRATDELLAAYPRLAAIAMPPREPGLFPAGP